MPQTVVVGGGIAGLTVAHRRKRAGADVVLLERGETPGGVVRTVRRDGFLLEAGPNTVRPTQELLALVEELDLGAQLWTTPPRLPRYVDFRGRLHAVPMSPGALLSTRLLSASGKLRLLTEPFRAASLEEAGSVRDFFARRCGPELADRLVAPFVSGIFAGDASRLSAAAAFPTLVRWERKHGGLLRGAIRERRRPGGKPLPRGLLSFRDGLATLPKALAASLAESFRPSSPVDAIEPAGGRWKVHGSGGELEAAEVILAASAAEAAVLVRSFAPEAAAALDGIPQPPLAVLHLAWERSALGRPLKGFGHLVVPDPSRRILGAVWSSSLFPGRAPEGQTLLTVFLGGSRDPAAASLPDEALVDTAVRDLGAEGLVRGAPRVLMLTRWAKAIPQYEHGHLERMEALERAETRWPGLRFLGNYRGGISVGDVVRSASSI